METEKAGIIIRIKKIQRPQIKTKHRNWQQYTCGGLLVLSCLQITFMDILRNIPGSIFACFLDMCNYNHRRSV